MPRALDLALALLSRTQETSLHVAATQHRTESLTAGQLLSTSVSNFCPQLLMMPFRCCGSRWMQLLTSSVRKLLVLADIHENQCPSTCAYVKALKRVRLRVYTVAR